MSYYRTVRLGDTDAAGVVYFAAGLSMCHEAYENSLQESGIRLQDLLGQETVALPIAHASIDFFRPLFCGDVLEIELRGSRVGDDRFEVRYQVFLTEERSRPVIEALTRHVSIDPQSRRRVPLPQSLISWLERTQP